MPACLDLDLPRIVGFALGEHHDAELAYGGAGDGDRGPRRPGCTGVVFHTDQGGEGGFNRSSQHLVGEVLMWRGFQRAWMQAADRAFGR